MNPRKKRIIDLEKQLEEQYKLLFDYEKIRDYASDPKEKRRAIIEISNTKGYIEYYEQELAKLRPTYKIGDLLRDALRRLNYSKQKEFIRRYLNTYQQKFGSFLIQGQLNFGQMWLVHLLLRRYGIKARHFLINLYNQTDPNGYYAFLREMGSVLQQQQNFDPKRIPDYLKEIIEETCQLLKNEPLVIVLFNPSNLVITQTFGDFWNNFWIPLCKKAHLNTHSRHLLLFMIATDDKMSSPGVRYITEVNETCGYHHLLKVPEIQPFTRDDFIKWVEIVRENRETSSHRMLAEKIEELFIDDQANFNDFLKNCDSNIPPICFFQKLYEILGAQMEDYTNEGLRFEQYW
jgi:hypothetical protein